MGYFSLKYSFHYNRYATSFLSHELFINNIHLFLVVYHTQKIQQLHETNNNEIVQEMGNYIDRKTSPLS